MKAFILLCVATLAFASKGDDCPENSSYNSCGTMCPLTCDNYNDPPKACVLMCNPGCHCDKGYVKTKDGGCVEPENCRQGADAVVFDSGDDVCDQPKDPGLCKGFFPKYYFDKEANECKRFIFGGCGGNKNNFWKKSHCEKRCIQKAAAPSLCDQDKEVGPCRALFPRYYFNKKTGECEKFIYGGCGGNENNFLKKEECEEVCKE